MTSYVPVIKNGASGAIFYVGLAPRTASGIFQANPTLAAGDVKISKDGGAFANLNTLPDVDPDGGKAVKVTLSQTETNADNIVILFSDAAGDEWCDLLLNIQTTAKQFDDLATQASVDTIDGIVDAILVDTAEIGAAGAGLTALASAANLATVDTVVDAIQAKTDNLPSDPADASVIAGRFDTLDTNLATVDTVADAIKAKTDNLPSDPADQSLIIDATNSILSAVSTVDGNVDAILVDTGTDIPATLATIGGYLDTEIAAIKAKTDNLPASPAATGDIPSAATIAAAVWASVLDGTRTAAQLARGWTAALLGKASGLNTGAASAPKYRDIDDSKDVISAVTDESGNRSVVTLDLA